MSLHVYYFDEEGWVVAESPEDAAKVYAEAGFEMPEEIEGEWVAQPDDKRMTMRECEGDEGNGVTKTCAEWAAGGRRYLGSVNY